MKRRVKFIKGQQKLFIQKIANRFGSIKLLAKELDVPYSTLKKYSCESLLIPEVVFTRMAQLSNLNPEKFNITYLDSNWGQIKAGKIGMRALQKKYPDKMAEWRRRGISKFSFTNVKAINEPDVNENLAEFFGVYLGDGTLTKYFIRISGDSRYDLSYFGYLDLLVFELFGIHGKISRNKKTNNLYLTIYSKKLCDFFKKKLGVKYGDKLANNTLIPDLFLNDSSLALACLRGLVDTDGCVSLRGDSFSISFFSGNPDLIKQIEKTFWKYGFFTYISKSKDEIGTNSKERVRLYFEKIGSSNLRHIVRFCQRFFYNKNVYQNEVTKYYQKGLYRDIKFPFKLITASSSIG